MPDADHQDRSRGSRDAGRGGTQNKIIADDKGFPPDIRAWCEKTGHTLVTIEENDPQRLVAVVRKSGG